MGRIAWVVAAACWGAFWYVYWFRAHRPKGRAPAATDRRAMWGLALETAAIFLAWFPARVPLGAGRMAASMILAPAGAALFAWAVEHLGRQFRIQAGLWPDHKLVRTGPYGLVRHPIYLSLFLLTLATALLNTTWWLMLLAAGLYVAGTEIRIRVEDTLLAARFGPEFDAYRRRVPAWLPPLR